MTLIRPLVVGPISTISRLIRVRGQFAGATVEVVSLGAMPRTVAKGTSGSADDRIAVDPTETLRADDILYAIQESGGNKSPTPNVGDPLGVPVQKAPTIASALPLVTYSSILYTCGRAIWLRGGVPGALGRLQVGTADIGSGTFEDEEGARFGVSPMLWGASVKALQSIAGVGNGPALSRTPLNLPGPANGPLAAPNIDPIPVACNTSTRITQVFDGAEVTLRRDNGQQVIDLRFMFDAPEFWTPVGSPLTEGEMLTVTQSVHMECNRQPTPRDVRVGRAPPIPKPIVAGPLCSGSPLVRIEGLIPGAGVEIFANGKVYQAQTPPQATSLDAIVDPLEAPAPGQTVVVTARQEQCGVFGPGSDPISVNPLAGSAPQHEIIAPLLACSPIVRVTNAHPTARLMAFSNVLGPISGFVMADAAGKAIIRVAPQLVAGHKIEVLQWACGGAPSKARQAVEFIESLPIPEVGDPFYGRSSVAIGALIPGATVEFVVRAKDGIVKEVGLFVAEDKLDTAHLQSPLADGDKVKARQGLCQTLTGYSSERATIVEPIQADWWQWSGVNPRNELWKEEYVVSGTFTNKGGTKIQDFAVTIFEDAANVSTTNHALVAPSQSVPGATPPIKKDWQWFIPGIWVVKGPSYLSKEIHYKALISAKDVTGSPYPPTTSAKLIVFVNVSKLKRTSGAYATGAAASAAAMAATIFLIAAAAVAYAAAAAAGAVALDPPEPDPNFRERIPLPLLGDVPAAGQERNVIRLFRLGERVMLIELTKSLIEGRRLGALAAEDDAWIETHTQDLAAATVLQRSLANEILGLAPQAKQEVLALVPAGTDLRPEREQLKASGLTTAMANQMQLPAGLRPGFDALLRSDVALPDPDIVGAIDATVAAMTEFADSLG